MGKVDVCVPFVVPGSSTILLYSFIVAVRILGILTCFRSQPQMSTFSSSHDETLSLQTFSGQNPGWFS